MKKIRGKALGLLLLSSIACGNNVEQSIENKFEVSPGYVALEDIKLVQVEGDKNYIALENKRTGESLELVYVNGQTHLGSYKHRLYGLKKETEARFFEFGKPAGDILYNLGRWWEEFSFMGGFQ